MSFEQFRMLIHNIIRLYKNGCALQHVASIKNSFLSSNKLLDTTNLLPNANKISNNNNTLNTIEISEIKYFLLCIFFSSLANN